MASTSTLVQLDLLTSGQNMQGHTVPRKVLPTDQVFSTGHPGPYRGKLYRFPPGLLQLSTCRDGTDKRHQTITCPEEHRSHRHRKTSRFNHIQPVLKELHWLPVDCRIKFKVVMLVYKIHQTGRPASHFFSIAYS